jgi:hypothetical protein
MAEKKDEHYFYAIIDQYEYDLTFAQQDFVKNNIDKYGLVELMRETYREPSLTERSVEYDHIRRYVAKIKRAVPRPSFTEEQISFIETNSNIMKPFELATTIFPDRKIQKLSSETQRIGEYLKALGISSGNGDSDNNEYRPPKAASSICRKINLIEPSAEFNPNDLTPNQKKCVEALKNYLGSIRFGNFMRIYGKRENGQEICSLFEEEFIKGVYDKPDLNSEELNMYINLCTEYVNIQQITESKIFLENKINSSFDDDDEVKQKLSMSWVELLQKREADLNNSKKRAVDLQKMLSSTRSQRLEKQAQVNESLAKFVESWKFQEGRERALKIAEAQNLLVKDELKRIENADEYIANVLGISHDEILRN